MSQIEHAMQAREFNNRGLWPDQRMTFDESVELSLRSINAYGDDNHTWIVSYSGGKDSSAVLSFVVWAIEQGRVKSPERLIILYADTGMELPPLHLTAMRVLADLTAKGIEVRHVLPPLDKRFFVYMLGRGVPPPLRTRRWCTERLKAEPIAAVYAELAAQYGEGVLNLTGVRTGESAVRDGRIAMSCSTNDGECGQGWFQRSRNSLAPMLHWRVCHIWRWIYHDENPVPSVKDIADIYLYDDLIDIRTGCIECHIVDRDMAFKSLLQHEKWAHLRPLTGLRRMYGELLKPKNRHRKTTDDHRPGHYGALGPLTLEARLWALDCVLQMQAEAGYQLVSSDEEARIRELIDLKTYPKGWTGDEPIGDAPYEPETSDGLKQRLLFWVDDSTDAD